MIAFIAGLLLFFGLHVYSAVRSRAEGQDIRKRWGQARYMGLYSIVSLIGFVLIIYGYAALKPSELIYTPPAWGRHVNMLFMLAALILFIASQLPAGNIKVKLKHPMLVAVKLWALGHLLSNGEFNSVVLFGAFLAYAVFDRIMCKRRGDHGAAGAIASAKWDVISVLAGLGIYAAFVMGLHELLFRVHIG